MNRLLGLAVGVALVASSAAAEEAWARRHRKNDVERTIKRCEDRGDWLKRAVDRRLDHSRLEGSRKEDRINQAVSDLENALDRLRDRFDRTDSWWETRVDVDNVLRHAREVDKVIGPKSVFGQDIKSAWRDMKMELNHLAKIYNLSPLW